ncbi:MAG: class I SAM-dependent methyltransferase [Chloroflexota bacterium]
MHEKLPQSLEGVSKTLLLPLLVRARESQRNSGVFKDDKAVEIVNNIDADFSKLVMHRHDEVAVIVRMRKFDRVIQDFLTCTPDGVVIHFGCGLDTRFERIGFENAEWFDLDVPEVMNLRKKLFITAAPHYHTITASVFETGWLAELELFKLRPILFAGEGVLPYFDNTQVMELFQRMGNQFPGCEMVCDAHSPFIIWADNLHLALAGIQARLCWKLKNPADVETWGQDFKLLEAWNYYGDDEPLMAPYRWLRFIPGLAKSSGIYHYKLGK